jgi:hypothetical protein
MMSGHISIPEQDMMGLNYEESFRVIQVFLKHLVSHLQEIHKSESIDDLQSYKLMILKRVIKMANTFNSIIERDKDYVIANIVIRSIADSISSYILIYHESKAEEIMLRHYLFICDGLNGRIKQLKKAPQKYDGTIDKSEFEELSKNIRSATLNYENGVNHAIDIIKSLSIYHGSKFVIDELIKNNNWKYKSLGSTKSFKYSELYTKLELNMPSDFFSCQSEFVHGLSTSNFAYGSDEQTFEPVYGIAMSLLGKLLDIIKKDYKEDMSKVIKKMTSGLIDEDMPEKYVIWLIKKYKLENSNK